MCVSEEGKQYLECFVRCFNDNNRESQNRRDYGNFILILHQNQKENTRAHVAYGRLTLLSK
jgi:hypothetical protein